jgi:hypothetical protein
MIVPMVLMTIAMTQTMQDQSNENVWPPFQSSDCTHDLMWWSYVFTIEHTSEWMVNQHMVNEILDHQFTCHSMHPKFHNLWSHLEFKTHRHTNLWQAQNNLVGTCEWWRTHDEEWLHLTTRHYIFGLET